MNFIRMTECEVNDMIALVLTETDSPKVASIFKQIQNLKSHQTKILMLQLCFGNNTDMGKTIFKYYKSVKK